MIDRLNLKEQVFQDRLGGGRERAPYAFGVWLATLEAAKLGLNKLTIIEFGVFTGAGLLSLCRICDLIHQSTDMEFEIFGFDTPSGMPTVMDQRDHPEIWATGDFANVDHDGLRRAMSANAELILGDIRETLPRFMAERLSPAAPVAFVSMDVDLYSSCKASLELFRVANPKCLLPATIVYFDDINDLLTLNQWCGEMLAIREFNEENAMRKLEEKRVRQNHAPAGWHDHIYACHVLDHPVIQGTERCESIDINITAI
jgi:hypothetical protein